MAAGINDTFRQVGIAVGIAAWGALFLGRGADKVAELAAGTPAAEGDRPRQLIEAASSGNLGQALNSVPEGARVTVATPPRRASCRDERDPPARRAALLRRSGWRCAGPRGRDRARGDARGGHLPDPARDRGSRRLAAGPSGLPGSSGRPFGGGENPEQGLCDRAPEAGAADRHGP